MRRAAAEASTFDWIVLTSANAVDALMGAIFEVGLDVRALAGPHGDRSRREARYQEQADQPGPSLRVSVDTHGWRRGAPGGSQSIR